MRAKVTVTLKSGVLDPQGKAIEGALASLGIGGIASVRQGKLFDLVLAESDRQAAEAALRQACDRLLANTVIENYGIEIDEASIGPSDPIAAASPASAIEAPPQDTQVAELGPDAPPASLEPVAAAESAAAATSMPTEGHP